MPAYFVDGVFTDDTPAWHGAGTVVEESHLTLDRVRELVPLLASDVSKVPLLATRVTHDGDVDVLDVDRYYATVRDVDNHVLGVVGSGYVVVQPGEWLEFGEAIVAQEGSAIWKTAGIIGENQQTIWGLLDLGACEIAQEEWRRHLLVGNSYDGSGSMFACTTDTRVVCQNTFNAAVDGAVRKFSIRHTKNVRSRMDEAARVLGLSVAWTETLTELADVLVARPVVESRVDEFLRTLIPYDGDAFGLDGEVSRARHVQFVDDSRSDLRHVWANKPDLESIRGTAWGVLQATFDWQQRYAYPDRIPAKRLAKVVEDGTVTTRALELALKL